MLREEKKNLTATLWIYANYLPQTKQNSRHLYTRGICSQAGAQEFFHDCQIPNPVNSLLN